MTTPASMAIPLMKPTTRKIRLPEELTAARALLPKKFPTIREFAVLYNCWNKLPRKSGTAKKMIFFWDTSFCHSCFACWVHDVIPHFYFCHKLANLISTKWSTLSIISQMYFHASWSEKKYLYGSFTGPMTFHKNFTTSHLVISPKNNYNANDQLVNH